MLQQNYTFFFICCSNVSPLLSSSFFQLQLIHLPPSVLSVYFFPYTTLCCVCGLSGKGSLTHTHTRDENHWCSLSHQCPLCINSHTNKLIHTAAPSNRLLSLLALTHMRAPTHTNTRPHTHLNTHIQLLCPHILM